jgi:hypothetical protein
VYPYRQVRLYADSSVRQSPLSLSEVPLKTGHKDLVIQDRLSKSTFQAIHYPICCTPLTPKMKCSTIAVLVSTVASRLHDMHLYPNNPQDHNQTNHHITEDPAFNLTETHHFRHWLRTCSSSARSNVLLRFHFPVTGCCVPSG